MSDVELCYGETSVSKEDANLVSKIVKQKHAASTEKDDATLLSEGSSDEDVEDDLVLEYSDAAKVSGEFQENVSFENGQSASASDDEVSGLSEEHHEYLESTGKLGKLLSIESEESPRPAEASQVTEVKVEDRVAKEEEISRIADELSTKVDLSRPNDTRVPGKPVSLNAAENHANGKDLTVRPVNERTSSSSSLSDSGRFSASRKNGPGSSDHSSGGELEWDEEYEFGQGVAGRKPPKISPVKEQEKVPPVVKKTRERSSIADPNEISHTAKREDGINIEASGETIRESTIGSETPNKSSKKTAERPKSDILPGPTAESNTESNKMHAKEVKRRSTTGGKSKKTGKRTRYKIYLDDPDIHQCIADYSGVLRKFATDVEKGKFVPKPESRLHPLSRDDVSEAKKKRSSRKKQMVGKSTSMDHSHATKKLAPIQQAQSVGNVGPYDGHGKRGRNLIARIKGLSESSSSSPDDDDDEDELTNARINKSRIRKGTNSAEPRTEDKVYDYCADCGQVHSADDDTNEESDQEICPDCGVPHNPFQHPPSPSAKNKWRQYVEHCRKAMLQLSNQSYHQLPQDPPEPKKDEILPSIEGPHTTEQLRGGVRYKMKYLGTTQVVTQHPVTKETRMEQAQEAFARIKAPEGEVQPATDTEMVICLERIKVVNCEGKHEDVMMDHALRTVCFICDMGDILVLMSRRLTTDMPDLNLEQGSSVSLSNLLSEREKRTSKNICHIFQCEEAQSISKAIGQAFNMAYRQFLKSNGISHDNVEEAEYCHVLESQKIVGQDLDLLADSNNTRDIVIQKKRSEPLGIMLLESGWGSMLPTVFVAHIAIYSPAARLGGQLSVGDHILSCNGASLVGLPLSECNQMLRNTRSSARVILRIVSCPPVVDVVVSRPDVKYQLGFSVQNGTICSLLRGGIAERGGVRVGHRIIEINGESVVAKSHQHIVDILASTSGDISMKTLPVAMYRLMVGIDTPTHV